MITSSGARPLAMLAGAAMTLALFGCPGPDDSNTSTPTSDMASGTMTDMGTTPQNDQGTTTEDDMDVVNPDQGTAPDMPPTTTPPMNIDEAQAQRGALFAVLLCNIAYTCPIIDHDYRATRGRYTDKDDCEQHILDDFELNRIDAEEQLSLTSNRATFDPDKAATCITTLEKYKDAVQLCAADDPDDIFTEIHEDCVELVNGNVIDGGDCGDDLDCAGENSYCDFFEEPSNTACSGVCVAFDVGAECDPECGPNEVCNVETLMCEPLSSAGESCFFSSDCQDGLFCGIDEQSGEDVCLALVAVGQPCDFSVECVEEAYCDFENPMPLCTELKQTGETCTSFDQCVDGLFCDFPTDESAEGTCAEPSSTEIMVNIVSMGEPCNLFGDVINLCDVGLACLDPMEDVDTFVGTCGPPRQMGGACQDDNECEAPLVCDEDGMCAPRNLLGDGEHCIVDSDCESGYCDFFSEVCLSSSMCLYMP